MNRLQRLIQLSAKTSAVVNLDYSPDDEPRHGLRNTLIGGGAVAGTVAAGVGLMNHGANILGETQPGIMRSIGTGATDIGKRSASYARQAAPEIGGFAKQAGGSLMSAAKTAGPEIGNAAKSLFSKLKGVRFSTRLDRLIQLRAKTESVIQFRSPLDEFKDRDREIQAKYQQKYRDANEMRRGARTAMDNAKWGLTEEHRPIQEALARTSYVHRGAGIGFLGGAAAGGALGWREARGGSKLGKAALATASGLSGGIFGAYGGTEIGGRIRRKNPVGAE